MFVPVVEVSKYTPFGDCLLNIEIEAAELLNSSSAYLYKTSAKQFACTNLFSAMQCIAVMKKLKSKRLGLGYNPRRLN